MSRVVISPVGMDVPDPLGRAVLATLPKVVREDGSLTLVRLNALLEAYLTGGEYVAQFRGTTAVNEAVAADLGVSLVPERSARAWV